MSGADYREDKDRSLPVTCETTAPHSVDFPIQSTRRSLSGPPQLCIPQLPS